MSGGNFSMNNHTLSQHYCDYNNGDVSSGYVFKNGHTIYQCEYSSTLKKIGEYFEKGDGDVSSGYDFSK